MSHDEPGRHVAPEEAPTSSSAELVVRRRVVVSGRVQGVYFRDSCRRFAQRLGLDGWVRNRPDGTVEAVFQGDALDVDDAVAWCRSGPPSASVIDIRVTDEAVIAERPFRIETWT